MSISFGNIWKNKTNTKVVFNKKEEKNKLSNINNIKTLAKKTPQRDFKPHTRKYWGGATWLLLHVIATRIDETYYRNNYIMIWKFMKNIFGNLPCPYCREHATYYIKNIKLSDVRTKSLLEKLLFNFHNSVNARTGKRQFLWSEMEIYKRANIRNIFKNFEIKFFKTYFGSRDFSGWIRNKFKEDYNRFYNTTINNYK